MSVDILGTSAEAWFNIALRPRKPEGSLGQTAQDGHLDSHTAPELCGRGHKAALNYGMPAVTLGLQTRTAPVVFTVVGEAHSGRGQLAQLCNGLLKYCGHCAVVTARLGTRKLTSRSMPPAVVYGDCLPEVAVWSVRNACRRHGLELRAV